MFPITMKALGILQVYRGPGQQDRQYPTYVRGLVRAVLNKHQVSQKAGDNASAVSDGRTIMVAFMVVHGGRGDALAQEVYIFTVYCKWEASMWREFHNLHVG